MQRYHPALVALHWLLAVLLFLSLCAGFFLAQRSNADPSKIDGLRIHMAMGMAILALMVVRFVVRLRSAQPPQGQRRWLHQSFYVLVTAMAGTGLATAIVARLNDIVFAGTGEPLPPDLLIFPTRVAHGWIALLLVALIGVHLGQALPRMARMSLGRR
ncbi:cytochrome b [Roseiterribacter gracilis]|uniref:Cytochrome b561 bacterial/Ni-hydrogenase domain-containing protein n=1 Tax=Roseiterribacter gracilis TaxID=2812848 RepID=A0A8S8XCM3_9PROT|nr:hypothetical protein TMPK1_20590 [Rhodospirillales bacterium TMPK1]